MSQESDRHDEDVDAFVARIGRGVTEIRTKCGLTRAALARLLEIDEGTLRDWESGGEEVPTRALYGIARICNIEPWELLGGSISPVRAREAVNEAKSAIHRALAALANPEGPAGVDPRQGTERVKAIVKPGRVTDPKRETDRIAHERETDADTDETIFPRADARTVDAQARPLSARDVEKDHASRDDDDDSTHMVRPKAESVRFTPAPAPRPPRKESEEHPRSDDDAADTDDGEK